MTASEIRDLPDDALWRAYAARVGEVIGLRRVWYERPLDRGQRPGVHQALHASLCRALRATECERNALWDELVRRAAEVTP